MTVHRPAPAAGVWCAGAVRVESNLDPTWLRHAPARWYRAWSMGSTWTARISNTPHWRNWLIAAASSNSRTWSTAFVGATVS